MKPKIYRAIQSRLGNVQDGVHGIAAAIVTRARGGSKRRTENVFVAMDPSGEVYAPLEHSIGSIAEVSHNGWHVGTFNGKACVTHVIEDLQHVANEWGIAA